MGKKILVVDDEPHVIQMLSSRLRGNGYEVAEATDGRGCLTVARREKPDLIILDILMPEMDGTEVAAELKKDAITKDIPVIFLTALRTKEDESRQGQAIGENTIFAKPYDPAKLLSKIRETIGS